MRRIPRDDGLNLSSRLIRFSRKDPSPQARGSEVRVHSEHIVLGRSLEQTWPTILRAKGARKTMFDSQSLHTDIDGQPSRRTQANIVTEITRRS